VKIARYRCSTCDQVHEGLPDLSFSAPYYFHQLTEVERAARATLTEDTCVIDDQDYFIRAVLEIPILDTEGKFGWGIWVSLSQEHFRRYLELGSGDLPAGEGPYFGWFSSRLPSYPETLNLKTHVHLQGHGNRPLIELEHTNHPLARHQHHGIALHDLSELVGAATRETPNVFSTPAV
jgi:hypothetical protein